jgi:hypothetical protein
MVLQKSSEVSSEIKEAHGPHIYMVIGIKSFAAY